MNRHAATRHCPSRLSDYASVIDVGICFAFQPLVDAETGQVTGHEALVRGCSGESALQIIAGVLPENLFYFDQACRLGAIRDADRAGLEGDLHLNCTEVDPDTIELALASTAEAVAASSLSPHQIVLEFSSLQRLGDPRQLAAVRAQSNRHGFRVLADNYGTGEAGLKRLAVFRPEMLKLDREVVSNVHQSPRRQAMVLGILATCRVLGITPIATGVEREEEVSWLRQAGVERFQGYFFARPKRSEQPQVAPELLAHEALSACAA